MIELGRGLSAWLSELYSSAPSDFLARGGRAENPLLWLVRAGIENDFERVVFPEYPELSEESVRFCAQARSMRRCRAPARRCTGCLPRGEAAVQATARLRKQGWAAQATVTLTRRAYWKRVVAG